MRESPPVMTLDRLDAPLRRRPLALVALALGIVAFAVSVLEVADPDMFHHLALGRAIVRSGLPVEEPFLYPMQGERIGPPTYWLGSVAIYGWHAVLGDGGLAFLPAAVAALLAVLLLLDSAPRGGRHSALTLAGAALPLALAVAAFRYRATARPELFAIVFLAATLWAVRRLEDGRTWPILAFPALAVLWTNVHPSLAAGLGVVGIFVAVGVALRILERLTGRTAPGTPSRRQLALGAGALLTAAVAGLATPSRMNPVVMALRFAASTAGLKGLAPDAADGMERVLPYIRHLISEMATPGWDAFTNPAGLLLALAAASFLLQWRRPRVRELATFLVFAALATRTTRFLYLFAVVSAPFAARNLGAALVRLSASARRPVVLAAACAALAAAVAVVPLAASRSDRRIGTRLARGAYPVRAADYLEANGFRGRLFNTFQFGGYLEWRGVGPPFQDGRGLLPAGYEEASIVGPARRAAFDALDAVYRFDALVLDHPAPLPSQPPISAGADFCVDGSRWSLVAFDDGALLFLRRDGAYAALAARDEYRWARPSHAPYYWPRNLVPDLLAEYRRSVSESPDCSMCRFFAASAALAAGRPDEAAQVAAPILAEDGPQRAGTLRVAARAAEATGDRAGAERLWAALLETGQEDATARRALARLALARGDAKAARGVLEPRLGASAAPEDLELALQAAVTLGDANEAGSLRARRDVSGRQAAAEALHQQGLAAARVGDQVAAVAAYRRSLELVETSPATHTNLGYAYLALGQVDDALREQARAVALDPRFSAAHYGLGMALERKGDRAGAAAAYRRYLELEPNGLWALKASQRVDALRQP